MDVIGYSAGGVIARVFVRDDGGADVVRRVLTLGSPHHGAEVAAAPTSWPGGCPKACEQLAIDSDLLRHLNAGDETPAGPEWATIRSAADQTVTPTDSARLDGALNIRIQDLCPDATTVARRACPATRSCSPRWRRCWARASRTRPPDVSC